VQYFSKCNENAVIGTWYQHVLKNKASVTDSCCKKW